MRRRRGEVGGEEVEGNKFGRRCGRDRGQKARRENLLVKALKVRIDIVTY